MGLLVECPQCKKRNSIPKKKCQGCGFPLAKFSGKAYWIEYYIEGQRKRERVGPNKAAAEQRLRTVLNQRTEERFIDKDPAAKLSLGGLTKWYLGLIEVQNKKSYRRDQEMIHELLRTLGEDLKIKDLTPGKMESYQSKRLMEVSRRITKTDKHPGDNIKPATVNKEVSCLKTALNRAVRHGLLKYNPLESVKKLSENNIRMKVLDPEEFDVLLKACPGYLQPVVLTAYYTAMRRSEITFLTWDEVDLESGFIRLPPGRTKTGVGRTIPLHPRVRAELQSLPRAIHTKRVFLKDGEPFDEFKHSYGTACKEAGLADFTFHDLRHCAINALRLVGNDYFKIMAISGHKTMACFKRYNLVTEQELKEVKWPGVKEENYADGHLYGHQTKMAHKKTL
jgi:integrase